MSTRWSGGGATKGAEYGSVIPGLGTSFGAVLGGLFGGGGGSHPVASDPYADQWNTEQGIQTIGDRIKNGQFQFGNPSDKAAVAVKQYQAIYGRNPTTEEIARALSSGDINGSIANQKYSEDNSPANIYKKQQDQWSKAAPEHYDAVKNIIQSTLGRQATQDELSHYGTLIASGQADPYQIQQFVQSTPEYQNAQDKQFRSGLDSDLQKSDTDFFNTQKGNIAQQYAQMGRATSPALDVALTQLASQLNSNRQNYLGQLSASQYGGNKEAALGDYNRTKTDVAGRINANTQGLYGDVQNNITRSNNLNDYQMQRNDWNDAMNKYGPGRSPGPLDYLNTGLNAAKTGAQVYGAFA